LTSALDRDEWSASHHSRFTPRGRAPGTQWIRGWVGPRAGLNAVVWRRIPVFNKFWLRISDRRPALLAEVFMADAETLL